MRAQPGKKINSGIEPVDELMSGLDRGQLYLVHGEASGKSLFGIRFLIEGLKQGRNGALVIRYSPEDAVRRFARLGYDCIEDVYSGRLVILEYSDDINQKIGKLRELTPLLRELEWLLGETRPERLIFDPVASVLAGASGNIQSRATEFANWARSFGPTVVLIANETNPEIIESFRPLVAESFRFDVREVGERAARFLAFENSVIADQAIEVDPSRGVFLLGSTYSSSGTGQHHTRPKPPSVAELESIKDELRAVRNRQTAELGTTQFGLKQEPSFRSDASDNTDGKSKSIEEEHRASLKTRKLTPVEEEEFQTPRVSSTSQPAQVVELDLSTAESAEHSISAGRVEPQVDELSYLLDDLSGSPSPLDIDLPKIASDQLPDAVEVKGSITQDIKASDGKPEPAEAETSGSDNDRGTPSVPRMRQSASSHTPAEAAARAVELLLSAPQGPLDAFLSLSTPQPAPADGAETAHESSDVQPKNFNVLIIEDDVEMCSVLTETLGEYSIEVVHDGVSGLARLISFKPDLVVLDFDLPIIDGFKVLTLIRTALNVPIIIVSGSRMRAVDRVMASELGADYYLTKPFSAKELKYKAKQLIARYRGVNSWIVSPAAATNSNYARRSGEQAGAPDTATADGQPIFTPYTMFAAEVEKRVKTAVTDGAKFSIVGCRLQEITSEGGQPGLRLLEIVRELARDGDLISTNSLNDMVILLDDAGSVGARAFVGRLRSRVLEDLHQEPAIWTRSFPELEEPTKAIVRGTDPTVTPNRPSSDRTHPTEDRDKPPSRKRPEAPKNADPLDSYIDFLEQL
jgi:CheY-like chemotaxis protein/KaiC/GvpD/RAD55 family RecA-like ATPase